jgi:hypothetical protein
MAQLPCPSDYPASLTMKDGRLRALKSTLRVRSPARASERSSVGTLRHDALNSPLLFFCHVFRFLLLCKRDNSCEDIKHGSHKTASALHRLRTAYMPDWILCHFVPEHDRLTQPLCSSCITRLHRSYELVRPSAPHRYSRLVASTTCASPFTSERLVPAVPHKSLDQLQAPFTPVAACPVIRFPAGLSQEIKLPLVLTTSLWITTRYRKVHFRSSWQSDVNAHGNCCQPNES